MILLLHLVQLGLGDLLEDLFKVGLPAHGLALLHEGRLVGPSRGIVSLTTSLIFQDGVGEADLLEQLGRRRLGLWRGGRVLVGMVDERQAAVRFLRTRRRPFSMRAALQSGVAVKRTVTSAVVAALLTPSAE